ncbi:MAG: Cof-type HAD-IIB family hydrolase [Pyrinomonadaceae bacterium]
MIKLLALDLDGTLLDSAGKVPETNILAIRNAERAGVLVTLATGRRFRDASVVAKEVRFNAPIVTHNGALIKFVDSLETVSATLLPPETAGKIIEIGKKLGFEPLVSTDPNGWGKMFYDKIGDENLPLKKYFAWAITIHGRDAKGSLIKIDDVLEIVGSEEIIHISFSGKCLEMNNLQTELKMQLEGAATVLATEYPKRDFTLLDILSPDASKGIALSRLATSKNLASKNVMVIGDNYNDLEMLNFAGVPVVMGNAEPGLLEGTEFYTTLSNDENGVAAAIEKFILGELNG